MRGIWEMQTRTLMSKVSVIKSPNKLISVAIFFLGSVLLGLVGFVTLKDLTFYAKTDLVWIFLENRTGQPIGIELIYYLLVGLNLFGIGLFLIFKKGILHSVKPLDVSSRKSDNGSKNKPKMVARVNSDINKPKSYQKSNEKNESTNEERFFSGCKNHFGYLSKRSKDTPIPPECIVCQRLGDCMVANIYLQKEG